MISDGVGEPLSASSDHRLLPCASALELHGKLVVIFGEQLDRFKNSSGSNDIEQAAKALAILAKTLESIASVSIKLGSNGGVNRPQKPGGVNERQSELPAAGSQELDRQIIQLVEGLVEAGENDGISGTGQ